MTTIENIQKLRVKVAYLWGLGIGITVTAFQLTPKDSTPNDKYAFTALLGAIVLVAAVVMTFYIRRQEKSLAADPHVTTKPDVPANRSEKDL